MVRKFDFNESGLPSIPGNDYVVLINDCHTGKERVVPAAWKNNDFKYCSQEFVAPTCAPTWEKQKRCHLILGWCKLSSHNGA